MGPTQSQDASLSMQGMTVDLQELNAGSFWEEAVDVKSGTAI